MPQTFEKAEEEVAQAIAAANAIFDNPDAPVLFEPTTDKAAKASIEQLNTRLADAPGTFRLLVDRSRRGGEMLSNDRLQGLSEIAQNAEDVGATRLTFRLTDTDLIASHDGRPITLKNVWAMSLPWITTKTSESESLGRFGIGLTALRTISPSLDVFCGPYAFRVGDSGLTSLDPDELEDTVGDPPSTSLRVSLYPGVVDSDLILDWLEEWSESALLFCQNLSEISFETPQGMLKTLRLNWSEPTTIRLELGGTSVNAISRFATAPDGRRWIRWTADVATPMDIARRYKKSGSTMPLGVAVPLFEERIGRIHAGLPLADIDLPASLNAHFDPTTGRQGILNNDWNALLIESLADLWVELMLELLQNQPRVAWRLVPQPPDDDGHSSTPVEAAFLDSARTSLAARLTFRTDSGKVIPLSGIAYEVALLEGVLRSDQVAAIANAIAALPPDARDMAGRWRWVLDDWRSAGADVADPVSVADALSLLDEDIEVAQTVALGAAALQEDLEAELLIRNWLSDETGHRHAPPVSPSTWVFTTANDQWALDLGLALKIHPDTLTQGEASEQVVKWLRQRGSLVDRMDPGSYLERLAEVGEAGKRLTAALTDSQLVAIRDAVQQLPPHQQLTLGPGIGQAILIEAFEYTGNAKKTVVTASPSDIYLPRSIDREPDSFAVAAGSAQGIRWAASRYSTILRSPHGRAGLGAQRFLRLLGAETAPRLVSHPDLRRRYENDNRLGLAKYAGDSLRVRSEFLTSIDAQYTLDDYCSPDLDAVLEDIASHRAARQRRTRAAALVSTLGRAWDRISDQAEVTAANDYYGWNIRDNAPAFWVWKARTIEWLDNTKAVPSAPNELWLKTPANVVVHGADSPDYLHKDIPSDRPEILTLLGVTGEPTMMAMVDRLSMLRESEDDGQEVSSADTALLYQGIARQVGRRRHAHGHLNAARLKARFSSGRGLIRTGNSWWRPSEILRGPPVFGHLRPFVPQVDDTEQLWVTLGVPEPSLRDCVEVLQRVAAMNQDNDVSLESIELDTLRLLARLVEDDPLHARTRTSLGKLPVRTSLGRRSTRPVFVITDPVVAEAMAQTLPLWRPGGQVEQFTPLVGPFQISRLGSEHQFIEGIEGAEPDEKLTELFRAAVAQLREDLVRNDPPAAASLIVDWSRLESFDVLTVERLTAHVKPPNGREVSGTIDVYADPDRATLYITDLYHLDNYDSGARAVAALFSGDSRRIAQAWLAACAKANSGRQARRLELAEVKAEEEKRRQAKAMEHLATLQAETSAKPTVSPRKRRNATADAGESPDSKMSTPRRLVDPGELVVINPDGQIVGGEVRTPRRRSKPRSKGLVPVRGDSKPLRSHASPKEYTEIDKETVGLDLVRTVLRSDDAALVDLRSQRGVGADAVDELRRFYELKVYKGDEPNEVRLEPSEIDRAKETEGFFLVVLSNVEVGHGITKVRIITDPLTQLDRVETRAVSFSGVRTSASLVYELAPPADGDPAVQMEEENG